VQIVRLTLILAMIVLPLGLSGCGRCGFENPFKACSDKTAHLTPSGLAPASLDTRRDGAA
jgi:hypothetical protein